MSFNERGEYIRDNMYDAKKEEENPIFELAHLYDGLTHSGESVHPHFAEKPRDVSYWYDVAQIEQLLEKMEQISADNHLTEIIHPESGEKIILKDFFEKINKSIAYSKDMNERVAKEPLPPEISPEKRREIRERLLRDQNDESFPQSRIK